MGWFDKAEGGSLSTRLALDTQLVQDSISEKVGASIQSLAQFITGFVIAFVKGWQLALVMLAGIPVMGKEIHIYHPILSISIYNVVVVSLSLLTWFFPFDFSHCWGNYVQVRGQVYDERPGCLR